MKISIKQEYLHEPKILIDKKDVSKKVKNIRVETGQGLIPTVIMEFIPDNIDINLDVSILEKSKLEKPKGVGHYDKF